MLGKPQDDRRHEDRVGDRILLHGLQELLHVKPRHRHHRGPLVKRPAHDDHHAVDMVERQQPQHDIALPHFIFGYRRRRDTLRDIRHEVVVRQHHPLGKAGRAARIGQHHQVLLGVNLHRRKLPVTLEQAPKRGRAFRLAKDKDLLYAAHFLCRRQRIGQKQRDRQNVARACILELVRQLVCRVKRVDRGVDRPQ